MRIQPGLLPAQYNASLYSMLHAAIGLLWRPHHKATGPYFQTLTKGVEVAKEAACVC
jgi:hypothetical protein